MLVRRLVVVLALGAALPASASALDKGVVLDPVGPSGKEYALPLDAARAQLTGLSKAELLASAVRRGVAAPGSASAPAPLFGRGLTGRGVSYVAPSRASGAGGATSLAALSSARAAAGIAARVGDGGVLAGGGGGLLAGLVLAGGFLGGLGLRRLGLHR